LGEKWIQAVPVVQASALPTLVYALGFFLSNVLTAIGRPGLRLALTATQAAAATIFVYVALPWGPSAVALAVGAAALLAYVVNAVLLQRLVGLGPLAYHRQAWPAALATAVMAGAVWAAGSQFEGLPAIAALALKIAVGGLTYLGATLLLARGQWREMLDLLRSLKARPGGLPGPAAGG
jgi:O-antigen/teichoic acid export membrane protein